MLMAKGNYGTTLYLEGKHPRKELLEQLGVGNAQKMYADKLDGTSVHVGYIVHGEWFTFYTIEPWEKKA